uniref:M48 family metallopeptidase n=1 Tax=Natronorubrum tibetense TaxID=63128 RepID=UPI0023AA0F83|nr:M56 family metallopeptidase [Natronorubrum tibetense]
MTRTSETLQRTRVRVGLWLRIVAAGSIATLGFVCLFLIEVAAITLMSMFMLVLAPFAVAMLLLFIGLWVFTAGLYRRLMPTSLVVGRISNKWLGELEQVAHQVTNPRDGLERRPIALMLSALVVWIVGVAIVESITLISRFDALLVVSTVIGVGSATYYTGKTITEERGRGGVVEAQLVDDIDVLETTAAATEKLAGGAEYSLEELQARVDRLAAQAGAPAPTVRLGRERVPFAATVGFRPGTSTIIVSVGLCTALSTRELEAVLAHELAHAVNRAVSYTHL